MPARSISSTSIAREGGLQIFDHVRLDAGIADHGSVLRDVPHSGL
jgi:hypothetical protein